MVLLPPERSCPVADWGLPALGTAESEGAAQLHSATGPPLPLRRSPAFVQARERSSVLVFRFWA